MVRNGVALAFSLVLSVGGRLAGQVPQAVMAPNPLPDPTGSFAIGRATYHWVDSARAEFLDPAASERRELLVDLWYPASGKRGPAAPYLPGLATLKRVLGDSVMRRWFAPEYEPMEGGRLRTHATESAPVRCGRGGCPVLIFSHGGGVDRSLYTAQYEDLASHGYIVAVIAHTYDTHLLVFPDGRAVRFAPQPRDTPPPDLALPRWQQGLAREEQSRAYVRRVMQVEAADIRFVVDRLTLLASDAKADAVIFHQIDLTRLGALGHSLGGEAAALACQTDARIKACLNQDGAMHGLPFSRNAAGGTMAQPFMSFARAYNPPPYTAAELAQQDMTAAQDDSIRRDVGGGPALLLADMPAGAFIVSLTTPGVVHMSFSDEPILQAGDDSAKAARARTTLRVVRDYTRAFFDKTLLGRSATPIDHMPPGDSGLVTIQRFPPKPRR